MLTFLQSSAIIRRVHIVDLLTERFKNFAPVVPKVLPALTEVATDMWAVG